MPVSTADHAGRPVGPSSTSGPGPYSSGGASGAGRSGSGGSGSGALRRLADADSSTRETTRPVPVQEGSAHSSTPTTALPKYPAGDDRNDATAPGTSSAPTQPVQRNGRAERSASARTPSPAPVPAAAPAATPTPAPSRRASGAPAPARPAPARRVRLTVSRVDPWSAMKMSFLLSVALGIAMVVMVAVLWTILEGMGVFDQVNGVIGQVVQDGSSKFDILDFIGFTRVVSLSIVVAVVDVILITAIATLGAFLYNVSSALVGGVQLTLTDD
jgi:hypothetical protein